MRDALLQFAADGLLRPKWSERLLNELHWCEVDGLTRAGVSEAKATQLADRLIDTMCEAFADALVDGWEPLEGTFGLPDPDDEHVVAAAVVAHAGAIVTSNLRDFPPERVPAQIEVLDPDTFALRTIEIDPGLAMRSIEVCAERTGRGGPKRTAQELISHLATACSWSQVGEFMAMSGGGFS